MPVVVVTEQHKEDLGLLASLPVSAIAEFAKISMEFLRRGPNPQTYSGAASKLGTTPTAVKNTVEALSYIFSEAAKNNLNDIDFLDTLMILGFPKELNDGLKDLYLLHKKRSSINPQFIIISITFLWEFIVEIGYSSCQ